ncbi:MAG: hypothetical protein Q7J78_06800 [Clostridiales bacterium]|nr:hypothetical protein [Clostridiales bacterium]
MQLKKDNLVTENLEHTKDISKMQAVKGIIGDGSNSVEFKRGFLWCKACM